MKRLLLMPLLLGAQLSYGQLGTPSSVPLINGQVQTSVYTQLVDSLTAPLNKSRVPSGILYDRVQAYAMLHEFTPAMRSSNQHFRQSYLELQAASYTGYGFGYTRDKLEEIIHTESAGEQESGQYLPLGVLDYNFGVLDTLAEERRSVVLVNGLYGDGPVGNPYQTRRVTIATFLSDSTDQGVMLRMPSSLLLNNTFRAVKSVIVSTPYRSTTLTPGATSAFFFGDRGLQTVSFTITFTDNSTVTAKSEIFVKPTYVCRPTAEDPVPVEMANVIGRDWLDYTGRTTYGEGSVRLYMYNAQSRSDLKLRRPMVVIDGFDPHDKRSITKIFNDFKSVGAGLEDMGQARDLVILNFPRTPRRIVGNDRNMVLVDGGADFIERNALVVVELLNQLKSKMANPNEKITIIGPSMGGLISRYALALMEKNYADASNSATYNNPYWKHNVDTWLSFDAPHQGANIPVGDQAFVNYFAKGSEGAAYSLSRLNSFAARQMLVHQWLNLTTGTSYHERFMRALQSNGLPGSYGYPTQVRRVGLANGDGSGALNSLMGQPGGLALQLDVARTNGNKRRQFFYRDTTPGTQVTADIYFTGAPNVKTTVFNGEARVLVSAVKGIKKRWQVTFTTPANYDLAPGGFYDAQQEIVTASLEAVEKGYTYRFFNVRPIHNFIPTVSALGFQYRTLTNYTSANQLPDPSTNLQQRDLVCNQETPFDAYYVHDKTNTKHVTFEVASAQEFLFRELIGQSQPARFKVAAKEICPKSTLTLGLDECLRTGSVTYNWTLTGPAVFGNNTTTATNGGLSQNIRSTGAEGTVTVSVVAYRSGAAPSPVSTYSFTVKNQGQALSPQVVLEAGQVRICPYSTVQVQAVGTSAGPYYWTKRTISSSTGAVLSTGTFTTTTPYTSVSIGYNEVSLSVTAPSACGGSMLPAGEVYISPDVTDGKLCDPYSFAVYPTPTNQYLMVTTISDKESPAERAAKVNGPEEANPHAYQVTMYNDRGKKVQAGQTKTGGVNLDTSTLPNGLYHVQMRRGSQTVNRNISIQH